MILQWLCCTLSAQQGSMIVDVNIVDVSGCDPLAKNGSIEIQVENSEGPYTYQWKKMGVGVLADQNTNIISDLDTGRYVVTVLYNDMINSESLDFTVSAPDLIKITHVAPQDALCKDDHSGQITAQVSDGSASRNYTLLNEDKTINNNVTGVGSGVFTGLSANTYHIAVKNAASCTDTVRVIIGEPEKSLTLLAMQSDMVSCTYGNDGNLTVTINGGVGNYILYIVDTNQNITNTMSDLKAGTHTFTDLKVDSRTTVSITDANHCTASTVLDVREMRKPYMLEPIIENIKCYNEKGIIHVRAEAYNEGNSNNSITTYWIKGDLFQETDHSPNNFFEYLNGGTYYLYAQDSYGCIGVKEIFLSEPKLHVELSPKNITQPYDNVKGSITFAASGGWEGYTIECWKIEFGYQIPVERLTNKPADDYRFNNLDIGKYLFTIEDKEGCFGQHHLIQLGEITGEIDPETAGLKIFPNPSNNGKFFIEWNSSEDRKVTLELYSIKGQLVYKTNAQTGARITLDVSNLKHGTYLLHVPELNMNRKLVIH